MAITPIILAATAVAGVGLQVYGTAKSTSAAKAQSQYQQQIAADQQRQEALRQKQMELDARRRQLEQVRNMQKARALALSNANAQGAQFGSGLPGGFGQISGEGNTQLLGVNQSLLLGRENFGLSADISSARYGYAGASGQYATGQGLSSLGGGLISALGPISNLSGGFGSGASAGPSSYGNYGGISYPIYGKPY